MNHEPLFLGIGHTALDHFLYLDHYPEPDEKMDAQSSLTQGGGPVPTACVTLARMGRRQVMFAGVIGQDAAGRQLSRGLEDEGVSTCHLIKDPLLSTPEAHILVAEGSQKRTVVLDRTCCRTMDTGDLDQLPLDQVNYLLLDGRDSDMALEAAARVRHHGGKIMLDLGSLRVRSEELIACADYCVVSRNFIMDFLPDTELMTAARQLHQMGPQLVVITLGAGGAVYADTDDSGWSAPHAVSAVDTTGAGDVYHGALLHALVEGYPRNRALQFAAITAALKCRQPGGRTGIPEPGEVIQILEAS